MDHLEVGKYWNDNAEAWTTIARAGFDIFRDCLNTPAFFGLLPDIKGWQGIDIGCGEGHNTRLLAERGAAMSAIDISEIFIRKAQEVGTQKSVPIHYQVASALALPFAEAQFDFATSFKCMMDIPEMEQALAEAYRVLRPGGFFQFSITHPCFDTPYRRNKKDAQGSIYAIEVGNYFQAVQGEIDEWIFGAAPPHLKNTLPRFKTPKFTRTLSHWVNALVAAGFSIEQFQEPCPDAETVRRQPRLQGSRQVAYFLHIRCRKPQRTG